MSDGPAGPLGDAALGRHLLVVPGGADVGTLAVCRFAAARWEEPEAAFTRAARGAPIRALRLGRLSRLVGPFPLTPADLAQLGVPGRPEEAWQLDCPVERGDAPGPGGDRDGLARAFPDGLPVRDEERAVRWLAAVARRLGGSLRIGGTGTVLTPDPAARVDLVVYTDGWIEPGELLAVARKVVRRARPSGAGDRFLGYDEPVDPRLEEHLSRHGVQDEGERSRLAAEAAAYDAHMMSHPQPVIGFGIEADLDMDGIVTVEASGLAEVPLVLASLPWTHGGVVAYRVHWEPTDFTELELERPSLAHKVARGRATPQVRALARAVQAAVGGAILDESDFPVDPSTL